jgi:hypothetical protein
MTKLIVAFRHFANAPKTNVIYMCCGYNAWINLATQQFLFTPKHKTFAVIYDTNSIFTPSTLTQAMPSTKGFPLLFLVAIFGVTAFLPHVTKTIPEKCFHWCKSNFVCEGRLMYSVVDRRLEIRRHAGRKLFADNTLLKNMDTSALAQKRRESC